MPARARRSTDLPEPEGPNTAMLSWREVWRRFSSKSPRRRETSKTTSAERVSAGASGAILDRSTWAKRGSRVRLTSTTAAATTRASIVGASVGAIPRAMNSLTV